MRIYQRISLFILLVFVVILAGPGGLFRVHSADRFEQQVRGIARVFADGVFQGPLENYCDTTDVAPFLDTLLRWALVDQPTENGQVEDATERFVI